MVAAGCDSGAQQTACSEVKPGKARDLPFDIGSTTSKLSRWLVVRTVVGNAVSPPNSIPCSQSFEFYLIESLPKHSFSPRSHIHGLYNQSLVEGLL